MKDPVEAFMSDIAFDEGMGFSLGIGGPASPAEDARKRLAQYVKAVRRDAAAGEADKEERKFRVAVQRRVEAEAAKTSEPRAKAHLSQVLAEIVAELK